MCHGMGEGVTVPGGEGAREGGPGSWGLLLPFAAQNSPEPTCPNAGRALLWGLGAGAAGGLAPAPCSGAAAGLGVLLVQPQGSG